MTQPQLRITAIIFDLDGTLADTFPLIVSAWNAAISPHTGKAYSEADVISRFGVPDPAMIRREIAQELGDHAIEIYHAHYEQRHEIVKPFEGVTELLAELRERKVPLGLMTGKGSRSARITLKALGWQDTFGAVITGEDVEHQKPHPAGPLAAARLLGVPPTACAFVGDSPADIGAGKAAGMLTVAAGWHPVYHEQIRRLEPEVWANSPAEVLRILAG